MHTISQLTNGVRQQETTAFEFNQSKYEAARRKIAMWERRYDSPTTRDFVLEYIRTTRSPAVEKAAMEWLELHYIPRNEEMACSECGALGVCDDGFDMFVAPLCQPCFDRLYSDYLRTLGVGTTARGAAMDYATQIMEQT